MTTNKNNQPIQILFFVIQKLFIVFYFLLGWTLIFSLPRLKSELLFYTGYIFIVIVFFVVSAIIVYTDQNKLSCLLFAMIIGFSVQNIWIGFVSGSHFERQNGQILIGLKSLYIIIYLFILFLYDVNKRQYQFFRNIKSADWFGLLFIAFVLISGILTNSSIPIMSKITNSRNFIMPILAFYLGRLLYPEEIEIRNIVKFLLNFAVITSLIGFIEFFLINDDVLFDFINLPEVYYAKIGLRTIPGTLFTRIGEFRSRRLISIFYDPITAGFFFTVTFVYAVQYKKIVYSIIIGLALFLTFHKASWAIAVFYIGIIFSERLKRNIFRILIYSSFIGGFVALAYILIEIIPSSATVHFIGLRSGIQSAINFPLGNGLGSGGYFSWMYGVTSSNKYAYQLGSESGIGSIGYQLGLLGLILYIFWLYFITIDIRNKIKSIESIWLKKYSLTTFALVFSYFFIFSLSENALSIYNNYIIFISSGIIMSIHDSK